MGPYLHVTIFSLTILPFSAEHPSLCNRLCSAQFFPLHTSRLLHTNHGFTIVATVRLDERGDSYFGTGFWNEIAKFNVLKAGTKIALHIKGIGHEIYANFPDKIIHPDFVRSKFSFQLSAYVDLPSNVK